MQNSEEPMTMGPITDPIKTDQPSIVGQNVVVFDLEIKNLVGTNGITWNDHERMGISCGVAFCYRTMEYRVFMDDNLPDLVKLLCASDMVAGFNIDGFDIPLLMKTLGADGIPLGRHFNGSIHTYDLLYYSRRAVGWKDGDRYPKGMKLDDHLSATFGPALMKTGSGEKAPALWQERRLGELISYCIADVKRECMLFERAWYGHQISTDTHGWAFLENPQEFMPTMVPTQEVKP